MSRSGRVAIGLLLAGLAAVLPSPADASTQNATSVIVSPDGGTVYAGFNGAGFSVFSRDPNTGELSLRGEAFTTSSGGPLEAPAIAVSPFGMGLYGVDGQSNTLFQYTLAPGGVTPSQSYPVLANTAQAKDPTTLVVSPDDLSVYVLTYGVQYGTGVGVQSDGKINAFQRNSSGDLVLVQTEPLDTSSNFGGAVGQAAVISPDGADVYVSSPSAAGGLYMMERDGGTGQLLTPQRESTGLNAGNAIAMSPDGDYIYETGSPSQSSANSSEIAVLQRNTSTGAVTQVNGYNAISGLSDMWGLTVSADGNCVYATSRADNSLGWFTRNASTGALTFGGVVSEGENGIAGLKFAQQVSVYDNNVYVASPDDGGIAVFSRNPTTCTPTFLQEVQDLFALAPPVIDPSNGTATLPVNVDTSGAINLALQPVPSVRAAAEVKHTIPVPGPGLVDVPISLSGQDEQWLKKYHQLTVQAAVTFTATGGTPTTKSTTITLISEATATPASISRLSTSPKSFSLAGRLMKGHCVAQTNKNRTHRSCRRPIAFRISYSVNEPASVTFTVAREQPGRTVRHRCVKPTRRNRKDRRCTQLVNLRGGFAVGGPAGANHLTFNGRLGGRRLGPGTYVLTATPAGGSAVRASFTITG